MFELRRKITPCILLTLALCSGVSRAAEPTRLEIEAGAGPVLGDVIAPGVTLRCAVDIRNFFAVGLRGIGVVGPRGQSYPLKSQPGFQAWAAFPEVRFHLPFRFVQPIGELGLGVGQVVNSMIDDREYIMAQGNVGLFARGSLGVRGIIGPVTVTLSGSLLFFTRVRGGIATYTGRPITDEEQRREGDSLAAMAELALGWRGLTL